MSEFLLSNGTQEFRLVYDELRKGVLVLRAIEHDLRKKIVQMLHEDVKLSVTDIYIRLRIEQSVASQHLAILRRAEIVSDERVGKNIYYSLNKSSLERLNHFISSLADPA